MSGIFQFDGVVKHYDWGGLQFIPQLLKIDNDRGLPYAEYWMGSHPLGDSVVQVEDGKQFLSSLAQLPYLFKVLDIKNMLSIQVHPTREAAEVEFDRENVAGIPLDSAERNYKDKNHKPELMVALSDFWLLHGFKPSEDMVDTLQNVVQLRELLPIFTESGYAGLYKHVMGMPQEEVNRILQPLTDQFDIIYKDGPPSKDEPDHWAKKAIENATADEVIDRGIFSIYLLNLVHLKKGEGIFQAAGVPHAYLEGQNVEIMANSDNVLRGGLTNKHIDVTELLKHVLCEATFPSIITVSDEPNTFNEYKAPVPDFRLETIKLNPSASVNTRSTDPEILLLIEGTASISNVSFILQQGTPSAFALSDTEYSLTAGETGAVVFRASGAVPAQVQTV